MTDQRAWELAEDCKAQDPRAAQFIEKALADERRRVWEEACVDGDLIEVSTLLAALVKQGARKKD